ncbi:MAG: hypothetical protein JWM58_2326 [Rhizobium sp.]|nr:hypothetical protein [Rhizobium sp.]
MRKFIISSLIGLSLAGPAAAGFNRWSSETEQDPFSGGKRVTVDYMSSIRSGVLIICDTKETGVMVRAIPGFVFEDTLSAATPEIEFAIDGVRILGQIGQTGAVGDNLAVAQTMLTKENAETFVAAFAGARKQVAVKDGISDRPYLLSARGSTKAGEDLVGCMNGQAQ